MNYAKRFYDLNTDPCGKTGSMGKSNAEEMEFWTLDEFLAFRDAIKDKPVSYMCFEILYGSFQKITRVLIQCGCIL